MSVRMTEITPSILSGLTNIETSGGEIITEGRLNFELVLDDSTIVENPPELNGFTHIGQIIGKTIKFETSIEEAEPDVSSPDIVQTNHTMPNLTEVILPTPQHTNPDIVSQKVVNRTDAALSVNAGEKQFKVNHSISPPNSTVLTVEPRGTAPISTLETDTQPAVLIPQRAPTKTVNLERTVDSNPDIIEQSTPRGERIRVQDATRSVQSFGISNKPTELVNFVTTADVQQPINEGELLTFAQSSLSRPLLASTPSIQPTTGSALTLESKIAVQVSAAITNTSKETVEIRLDPPELGRVVISINQNESGASVLVSSEKAEVAELLRRHSDLLSRELSKSGFSDATLEFSHQDRRPDGAETNTARRQYSGGSAEASETDLEIETTVRSISGGLDIRL